MQLKVIGKTKSFEVLLLFNSAQKVAYSDFSPINGSAKRCDLSLGFPKSQ